LLEKYGLGSLAVLFSRLAKRAFEVLGSVGQGPELLV
jgi:hypothetical protein